MIFKCSDYPTIIGIIPRDYNGNPVHSIQPGQRFIKVGKGSPVRNRVITLPILTQKVGSLIGFLMLALIGLTRYRDLT